MLQKCFCFDLETGGKIIAWYDIVSSVAFLIAAISYYAPYMYDEHFSDYFSETQTIVIYINWFYAGITCLGIIFGAVMILIGIAKKNRKLFIFWLSFISVGSIFALYVWIKVTVALIKSYDIVALMVIIYVIISLFIHVYFWVIIYSLFEKMRRDAIYSGGFVNPCSQLTVQYPASAQYVPQSQTGYTSQPIYPPQSVYAPQTGYPSQTGYPVYTAQFQPEHPTKNAPAQYSSPQAS